MVTIRALQPTDDLSDLVDLSRRFFREYEAHHEEFFRLGDLRDEDVVAFFRRSIESDDAATYVAAADGRDVAYITVRVANQAPSYAVRRVGVISGLMVHPDHRRRGIARRLVARAEAFFGERGARYYTVYTAATNRAALTCYERLGLAPLHINLLGTVPDPSTRPNDPA